MFILDSILEPTLLCLPLLAIALIHFFLFSIPRFKKKFPKKYIYHFNLSFFFLLLIMLLLFLPIGVQKSIPDDPSTQYIYSGWATGLFTFFTYTYLSEACTGCYHVEIHLTPLILNLLVIFTPLVLISFFTPVRKWLQKNILPYFQSTIFSLVLIVLMMILSLWIAQDIFLRNESFFLL